MNCLSCIHGDMKTHRDHTKAGLAYCVKEPVGNFRPARNERECQLFEGRPEEETAARLAWLENKEERA